YYCAREENLGPWFA
nr:immunoglobulin heavy chain junction region [Mus musculus]